MALGYALLHPQRIELSLREDQRDRVFDEFVDVLVGTISVGGDLSEGFENYLQSRLRQIQSFVEKLQPWLAPNGPIGWLGNLVEGNASVPDFGALLDTFTGTLSSVHAFRETLRLQLHAFIDGLPDATSTTFSVFLREQFNALTEILETRLRAGQFDRAAHRGFRSAVILRQVLGPFFEHTLAGTIQFDLRGMLKRLVDEFLARLNLPDIDRVLAGLASFRAQAGGLLTAFSELNASFSLSVSVSVGPQGMANGALTVEQAEAMAAPNEVGHWLWYMDLFSGVACMFCAFWEMRRTNNFKDHEADGTLNVIAFVWHAVQTVVRAAFRKAINLPAAPAERTLGRRFVNWLFSDQGNLGINLTFRFFGSFHDISDVPNWVMHFAGTMLRYYSNLLNTRVPYWTARSFWYFYYRKKEGLTGPVSLNRIIWAIWGPWCFFASVGGMLPCWEDYALEKLFKSAWTAFTLIFSMLAGPIAGYIILYKIAGSDPFSMAMAEDWATFAMLAVMVVLGLIAAIISIANIESDEVGTAIAALIVVCVVVLPPTIAIPILFAKESTGAANSVFLHWLIIGAGLVIGGALPYLFWWYYIDDSRDKEGYLANKDTDSSPYKLPYPAGQNWMCGQSIHGIFSHYNVSLDGTEADNLYSYDFDEGENEPALAARDGIVTSFVNTTVNGEKPPNKVLVQHMDWRPGHDPGADIERVLTTAEYIHGSQFHAWVDTGHRVVQGYHLLDIDNTGRSALNHLHFNVAEYQRITTYTDDTGTVRTEANEVTYPVIFADTTLRKFRNFPLIVSWPSGGGHIDGRPLSLAFYESENEIKQPVINPVRIRTSPADAGLAHTHFIEIDRRTLGTGAIPDSITLVTRDDTPTAGVPDHTHSITLSRDQLLQILGMRDPEGFTLTTTNGHSHGFAPADSFARRGSSAPKPTFSIVNPPAGQLLATLPEPYRLVGDQLVFRVNERATEYYFFGAHRPSLIADVALDRGVPQSTVINIGGAEFQTLITTTPRNCALLLNSQMRLGAGAAGRPIVIRCLPSIVIETRRRGRNARLQVTFRNPSRTAAGTGAFDDIASIDPGAIATHIDGIIRNGWPAPPAGLTATAVNDRINVAIGGAPVDLSGSSSRIAEVFTKVYDAALMTTRAAGPLPLSTGRVIFAATPPYQVPVLATHAEVRIDLSVAAFNTTNLTQTPLLVSVLNETRSIALQAGDDAPDALARRINSNAESVRAFPDGSTVVVQTVSAGASAAITISKVPSGILGLSTPGTAALPTPFDDSCAVSAQAFESLIADAAARATLPYNVGAVNPQARIESGRLVIEVAAGHTITATASFTGPPPFVFTLIGTTRVQTEPLAGPVALRGPAWIDLQIDGSNVRVPLDGECARIDLPPLDRLPLAGEPFSLSVNGGPSQPAPVTGSETRIAEVAAAIARTSSDIVVRLAYVYSIENALYHLPGHVLQLQENADVPSPGLASAGFLRDRATLVSNVLGYGDDQLNVPASLPGPLVRHAGKPVRAFTITETPTGGNMVWRLQPQSGFQIRATHQPVANPADPDPLGFPTVDAPAIDTAAIGATLDIRSQCRQYLFEVRDSLSIIVAASMMQLTGNPAMIRSGNRAVFGIVSPSVINVTVVEPGAADRTFAVDLTGVTLLTQVAELFDQSNPLIRAWTLRPPGFAFDVLHIETAGTGTDFVLRMDNAPMLQALGFLQKDIDLAANRLEVRGRGTVANTRAVTQLEIRAALDRAVECATGQLTAALTVSANRGDVVLQSAQGQVTIETEPAFLRAVLNVTETTARTTLAPGARLDTDNGTIIVKVGGNTVAVTHIWGTPATVRANRDVASITPAELTAMMALLQAQSLLVRVDGGARTIPPAPATVTTIEAAVEFIAGRAPEIWIGIVGGRVTIETRGAGSAHTLEVDFSAFATGGVFPAHTVLGFEASQVDPATLIIASSGRGSVERRGAIPGVGPVSLQSMLQAAAIEAAAPQSIYDVELETAAPARIRLKMHLQALTLQQLDTGAAGPGSIAFNPPGVVDRFQPGTSIEANYPAPQPIEPGVFLFAANVDTGLRLVHALLAGQSARLSLQMPLTSGVLDGKGFDLTSGGTVHKIRFDAAAAASNARIAARIESQSLWTVRAQVRLGRLVIQSVGAGSSITLILAAPADASPNAITENPATGFSLGQPLPVQAQGTGPMADSGTITAAEIQSVLSRGYIGELTDFSSPGRRTLDWRPYFAIGAAPNYATFTSQRNGCMSSVEPVVNLAAPLALNRSLERGSAVRGSVALPAFSGQKNLNGTLSVQLNDNAGVAGLPATVVVPISFPAGQYSARDVARRIHDELFGRGFGQAGSYPDGTVVVETRVPGLAGSVRIPAPGTGTAGADQTLLRELIGSATEVFGRGYPGAGFTGAGQPLLNGGRSAQGPAIANATWVFSSGANSTAAIDIVSGQNLADIQRAIDGALAGTPIGRIGTCIIGPDETLYVEQSATLPATEPLMMTVNGLPPPIIQPKNPGETPEWQPDPAIGFRFTTVPRTVYYSRDRFGNSVEAEFDNAQWVRVPLHDNSGAPGQAGTTGASISFPKGIYWTAIRNDAAKTLEFLPSGDMIISGGADDPTTPTRFFVHQARYWIGMNVGNTLRIMRNSAGKFYVEVLW